MLDANTTANGTLSLLPCTVTSMDIVRVRYENFMRLLDNAPSIKDFAENAGIDPNQVSQLKGKHRNLGGTLARRIEQNLGLEKFSLDQDGNSPLTGAKTIDARALERIICEVELALAETRLDFAADQKARLIVGLYQIWNRTGEFPNVATVTQYEAMNASH